MKYFLLTIAIAWSFTIYAQSSDSPKKVLMVVSSYGKEEGQTRPGYEFDEFSQAYLVFKSHNLQIDVASPKGGRVEADKYNLEKAYNIQITADEEAMGLLENTIPTANIDPESYDAIYIVGGKGAMFDLPFDPSLQDIILAMYQKPETVIAAVCHGPAVFANVKSESGYIIDGVQMTGFTNEEEDLFGKKWVAEFPFKLEDQLIKRGAQFTKANFMLENVNVSGKFITGQNPFSTASSAEEVVSALGLEIVDRQPYADEHTVHLVQAFLNGHTSSKEAEKRLKKDPEAYDMSLMAVYGYYHILANQEDHSALENGVSIVEFATPYFFNENLQLLVAKTYITLEEKAKAKKALKELIAKDKLKEEAEELLVQLD